MTITGTETQKAADRNGAERATPERTVDRATTERTKAVDAAILSIIEKQVGRLLRPHFVMAGIFGCIAIVVFYSLHLTPPPPRIQERGMAPLLAEMWKGFRVVAKNRKVLITSSTDTAKMIANGALMAFLPLYGVSVGLNPGEVGLLFTVQALTSLVSKPIMGRVSDSVGRQPLIVIGLVICAATFVCIPQVSMLWLLLLLSAGFGFGEAVVSSSSSALVADSSEFKTLGAGMGMQGTIGDIGHASGPLVAGILIARMNYANAFAIIAGLQLVAATVFWMSMRRT